VGAAARDEPGPGRRDRPVPGCAQLLPLSWPPRCLRLAAQAPCARGPLPCRLQAGRCGQLRLPRPPRRGEAQVAGAGQRRSHGQRAAGRAGRLALRQRPAGAEVRRGPLLAPLQAPRLRKTPAGAGGTQLRQPPSCSACCLPAGAGWLRPRLGCRSRPCSWTGCAAAPTATSRRCAGRWTTPSLATRAPAGGRVWCGPGVWGRCVDCAGGVAQADCTCACACTLLSALCRLHLSVASWA
jgi:hypothetical protein